MKLKQRFQNRGDIKVGVIGYGGAFNMGKAHLEGMRAAGMTPHAVTELDPKRLEVALKDYPGIATYGKVSDMLAKSGVDLVVVITPHNTHFKLAMQCLKAGKHVVLEKPMAITTRECDLLIAEARKRGLLLSTYHNRHWDGWLLKAKEVVDGGKIGKLVRIESRFGGRGKPGNWWRSSRSISGGILYDWGVHLLEYALQLADSSIVEVSGYATEGYWVGRDQHPFPKDANEDEARAIVRMKNGVCIDLIITSIDLEPGRGMMRLVGTDGYHLMEFGGFETAIAGEDGVRTLIKGPNPAGQYEKYYDNVAAALAEGAKLVITGEWARRPIHILDLAIQSAAKGRTLPSKVR